MACRAGRAGATPGAGEIPCAVLIGFLPMESRALCFHSN
ncbi:hypothetical protein BMA10247_A1128 [Burkholderia mallei NCTC 10247]|nr:hypothetical protein BMA10247_A1128 [Burkholderia mallei NCTC 10247]